MCHEKYHHDPDLQAVANYLSGLPTATSTITRERSRTVAALLLNNACCYGLLDYIRDAAPHLASGERARISTKLKAISARLQQEATDMLWPADPDDSPF